jgi:hypothetical protein
MHPGGKGPANTLGKFPLSPMEMSEILLAVVSIRRIPWCP